MRKAGGANYTPISKSNPYDHSITSHGETVQSSIIVIDNNQFIALKYFVLRNQFHNFQTHLQDFTL